MMILFYLSTRIRMKSQVHLQSTVWLLLNDIELSVAIRLYVLTDAFALAPPSASST